MLKRSRNQASSAGPATRFGGPSGNDPVEAGRRGGIASGIARRQRYTGELKRKVLESDGLGAYAAYRTWNADLELREREIRKREGAVADREYECRAREFRFELELDAAHETRVELEQLTADVDRLLEQKEQAETDLAALKATIAELAAEHDLELVEEDESHA